MSTKALAIQAQADIRAVIDLVLDGLASDHSKRAYGKALTDFVAWHTVLGRPL